MTGESTSATEKDLELKKFRFSHHKTAFDVDIDALEHQPWRNKNVDLFDYFNYGFNEKTWMQYCEKQLQLRVQMGNGPHHYSLNKPVNTLQTGKDALSNANINFQQTKPGTEDQYQNRTIEIVTDDTDVSGRKRRWN